MQKGSILVILGALFALQFVYSVPSSSFSQLNKETAVKNVNGYQKTDGTFGSLKNTFFAVSALHGLNSQISHKDKICDSIKGKGTDAESVYYESAVAQTLGCGSPASSVGPIIESSLKSSKPLDVAYALNALKALAQNNYDGTVKKDDVNAGIKKLVGSADDEGLIGTVFTTGLSLQALAGYAKTSADKSAISTVLAHASSLVDQAEGEQTLEFGREDGASALRVTSTYFNGLNQLANALGKKDVLKTDQIAHFTETFIQHKHASSLEDVFAVVEGLNGAKHATPQPLVVSLTQNSLNSNAKGDEGLVQVRVTDVFGAFASKAKVSLVKATDSKDKKSILNNQDLVAVSNDNTLYSLSNFLAAKPEQGFYNLEFKATPDSSAFSEVKSSVQPLKVISQVSISDIQLVVSDSIDEIDLNEGRKYKAEYPKAIDAKITVHQQQHLTLTFKVKNAAGKSIQPHQVFAHLVGSASEATAPATHDGKQFVAHLNVNELSQQLKQSGDYKLTLTIGDAFLSNSVTYTVGNVRVNYTTEYHRATDSVFLPKPEITHRFRVDERRPTSSVSRLFTLAVLSPFLFLFVGLLSVGANLKNFPMGSGFIWAVGFQACLAAILLLLVSYWLAIPYLTVNMVQTLTYLAALLVPTMFFAQKALNHVAQSKVKTA